VVAVTEAMRWRKDAVRLRNPPHIVMMDDAEFCGPDMARMENAMPNPDYSTLVAQQREFSPSGGTRGRKIQSRLTP
jgi:hypothetical protein